MRLAIALVLVGGCFWVTPEEKAARWDLDGDGVQRPEDCDDADPETGGKSWYLDADGDGFGDKKDRVRGCDPIDGRVADDTDCDDDDPGVHPGAEEQCNGSDDDCDSDVDEGVVVPTWYTDGDGDGFGDADEPVTACDQPLGAVADDTDCDDAVSTTNPGAPELPCNGVDDNCRDGVDFDDPSVDLGPYTWPWDGDGDGYGTDDPGQTTIACDPPTGYAAVGGDCADGNDQVHPGALERCNGFDDDCDGATDPYGSYGASLFFPDLDGDTFGDNYNSILACEQPPDTVTRLGDCDDSNPCVHVGAIEVCNGRDDDCDLVPDDPPCVPADTADTGGACP